MSENDDQTSDAPEFVAVTPRDTRDDAGPATPQPEPETDRQPEPEPDALATGAAAGEPEPAPEPVTVPDAGEAAPGAGDAGQAEAEPPAAGSSDTAQPTEAGELTDAAETGPAAPDPANPSAAETALPEPEPAAEPAAPAGTLRWTAPALERPAGPATEAHPQPAAEPEPQRPGVGDVEVSVRVAAEGMAAALAGHPVPDAVEAAPSARSVSPVAVVTAVCVVLALAAGALLAVTAHTNSHNRAVADARTAALAAAKRETAVALTYDYRTLDADFQRAEAGMSRKFRANYAQTAASSVAPLAQKTHAITTGTIAAGGVVSATPTSAQILVFANQTVQNKLLNATSRLDRSVIEVTMVKENGRWVIDNLQPF